MAPTLQMVSFRAAAARMMIPLGWPQGRPAWPRLLGMLELPYHHRIRTVSLD